MLDSRRLLEQVRSLPYATKVKVFPSHKHGVPDIVRYTFSDGRVLLWHSADPRGPRQGRWSWLVEGPVRTLPDGYGRLGREVVEDTLFTLVSDAAARARPDERVCVDELLDLFGLTDRRLAYSLRSMVADPNYHREDPSWRRTLDVPDDLILEPWGPILLEEGDG